MCAPTKPLPGGEYGTQLNDLLRHLEPMVDSVQGVFASPLSLSPEEMAQVLALKVPRALASLEEAPVLTFSALRPVRASGPTTSV